MADASRPPIWSAGAVADLSDIWSYYAGAASRRTADNIIRAIGDAVRVIDGRRDIEAIFDVPEAR
jgi:plasmid stabilization system protein ParE